MNEAARTLTRAARLARHAPGRRLRIEPKVGEDLLDHRPLEDGRDDLEFAATAATAMLHLDVEDLVEQSRPADGGSEPPYKIVGKQPVAVDCLWPVQDGRGLTRPQRTRFKRWLGK